MPRARGFVVGLLCALALTSAPLLAATFVTTELRALAALADVVVRVRVETAAPRWLEERGPSRIVTFHDARVLEVLQGRLSDDEARSGRVLIGVPGGVVGDLEQRVAGAPVLVAGNEYLVLLGRGEGPGGARGIAGLAHGVVPTDPALREVHGPRLDALVRSLRGAP